MRKQISYSYKILFSIIITIIIVINISSFTKQFVYGEEEQQTTSFSVIIPKTILLSGEKTQTGENKGEYIVIVKGNIDNIDTIDVKPIDSFPMQQIGKKDIIATITQDKTSWTNEDFDIIGNGVITTTNMTAGNWYGQFNFDIKFNKHTHNYEITNTIEATCEIDGTNVYTCSICNNEYEEIIAALGHNEVYGGTEDVHTKCSVCDVTLSSEHMITGMLLKEATCTTKAIEKYDCSFCGYEYTKEVGLPLGHDYGGETITFQQGDCVTDTLQGYYCQHENCDSYIINLTIKANGHNYENDECTICGEHIPAGYYTLSSTTNTYELTYSWQELKDMGLIYLNGSTLYANYVDDCSNDGYLRGGKLVIDDETTEIGDSAFYDSSFLMHYVYIPNSVVRIGSSSFEASSIKEISIPTSVKTIDHWAFFDNPLQTITFSEGLEKIGNYAFSTNSNLKEIQLPNSLTSLGEGAFDENTTLEKVYIPNTITIINARTFYNCINLTNVDIPNNVIEIGNEAFYNVPHITYNGTATGSPWGALAIN